MEKRSLINETHAVARPLRIGLFTYEYPTLGPSGGIGTCTQAIAAALVDLGHIPFVLVRTNEPDNSSWDGPVPVYGIGMRAPRLPWPLGASKLRLARRLARAAEQLKLDVLEAHDFLGLTAFLSLIKPRRLAVVVRLQCCSAVSRLTNDVQPRSTWERFVWLVSNRLEGRAISTADAVISVSLPLADLTRRVLRLRRNDFHLMPNPVDRAFFRPFKDDPSRKTPVVLFVGRLEWRKGPDLIVRALPSILNRYPDARLRLIGEDTPTCPREASMLGYLRSLVPCDVWSHVDVLGRYDHHRIPEEYHRASVCVFPSRWEGLPIACEEAMACGTPIVVSDAPMMLDLVKDGETGLIARLEHPECFAAAVNLLLSDPILRRRLGCAARAKAWREFRAPVVAEGSVRVYQKAIATARTPFQFRGKAETLLRAREVR